MEEKQFGEYDIEIGDVEELDTSWAHQLNMVAMGLKHGCAVWEGSPLRPLLDKCYSLEMFSDIQRLQADLYNQSGIGMPCGTWDYSCEQGTERLCHTTTRGRLTIEAEQYKHGAVYIVLDLNTTNGEHVVRVHPLENTYYINDIRLLRKYRISILQDIGMSDIYERIVAEYDLPDDPWPPA